MHPGNKNSDTMSEISDGGTGGTSVSGPESSYGGSNENLRELAAELGLSGVNELYEERFRVDRKKLEHMILGDDESLEPAEMFFQKIMELTRTHVMWPSRLKIGAKSKKDPHVRVAGLREDVKMAKEKIMEFLDTRSNRVTLKMDVSYTDHSHIIGKGGLTIRRVMEDTGCHIHFPDSNRNNQNEKSNQVSIAGELEGVEKARARVRNLTPLIFSFELPVVGTLQTVPENNAVLKTIQEKYNVHVMFRNCPKLYGTMVVIKGREWEVSMVKEATLLVMQHMCKNISHQQQVRMTLEISPQHHKIVLGNDSSNIKHIMQNTNTQIMFPDAGDPNIPNLKKSNVCITGNINDVYLARQQLMGSLPIVLMFDLPEEVVVDNKGANRLSEHLDVIINIREKPKQNIKSVIIRGIERKASDVYEARNRLLGLDEPQVTADIPLDYNIPPLCIHSMNSGIFRNGNGRIRPPLTVNTRCIAHPGLSLSPLNGRITPTFTPPMTNVPNPWSNGFPSPSPAPIPVEFLQPPMTTPNPLNQFIQQQQQSVLMNKPSPSQTSTTGSTGSSGYGSSHPYGNYANTLSLTSDAKEVNAFSCLSSNTSSLSSPANSPQSGNSPVQKQSDSTNFNFGNLPDLKTCTDRRAPGYEKKSLELAKLSFNNPSEFERRRVLAYQAMQNKPVATEIRVPNSSWSGYGLSQSNPAPKLETIKKEDFAASLLDEAAGTDNNGLASMYPSEYTNGNYLNASNYLDSTPASTLNQITGLNPKDLVTLLASLGLEKYISKY